MFKKKDILRTLYVFSVKGLNIANHLAKVLLKSALKL